MTRPAVAIYRRELLASSETFIREQGEHLERFRAFYVGQREVPGLELPRDRVVVLNRRTMRGRLAELRLMVSGSSSRLTKMLQAVRPVLVHAHFEGGGIAALKIARSLGIPLVVTCHGYDVTMTDEARWPNRFLRAVYRRRRRRLQQAGDLFIAVSEHIKRHMLARGYPTDRIRVHYIGVDSQRLNPDPHVVRTPIVLFVGRLVEKKGCEFLIRAMPLVQRHCRSVRLVVIGEGPLGDSLKALARDMFPQAEFLGAQSADEVRAWMNRAMVLSVPTVRAANGDTDGCSMVFPEAQAMKLPVASFNTGGTAEAVLHERTGLLVPERDSEALAGAIVRLLTDSGLWSALSEAARPHVEQRFNLSVQTRALEEIYQDLLNPPRSA